MSAEAEGDLQPSILKGLGASFFGRIGNFWNSLANGERQFNFNELGFSKLGEIDIVVLPENVQDVIALSLAKSAVLGSGGEGIVFRQEFELKMNLKRELFEIRDPEIGAGGYTDDERERGITKLDTGNAIKVFANWPGAERFYGKIYEASENSQLRKVIHWRRSVSLIKNATNSRMPYFTGPKNLRWFVPHNYAPRIELRNKLFAEFPGNTLPVNTVYTNQNQNILGFGIKEVRGRWLCWADLEKEEQSIFSKHVGDVDELTLNFVRDRINGESRIMLIDPMF